MERNHGMPHHDYSLGGGLEFFTCYTLVDISKTGVVTNFKKKIPPFLDDDGKIIANEETWTESRNKQRNWETMIQWIKRN